MPRAALPLVLIPGFMLDETLWDEFVTAVGSEQRCIRASLAGGDSIAELAEQIVKSLPERFILVGFSLGGYVARAIVEACPQRVAGLILLATSLREDSPQQAQQKRQAAEAARETAFGGLSTRAIAHSLHPDRAGDRTLIGRIKQMGDRLGGEVFHRQSALVRQGISRRPVDAPTLIIAALQDRLRSLEESQELQALIPGAELECVDQCGHMLPLEQPHELAERINAWLARSAVTD